MKLPSSRLCTHLVLDFSSDCLPFFSFSSFSFLSFLSFSFFILAFFWLSDFLGGFFTFVWRKQKSCVRHFGKLQLLTGEGLALIVPRIPPRAVASLSQTGQGSGAAGASWTSSVGDHPHLRLSCCCYCRCRSLFCSSPSSFSHPPPSPSPVAGGAPRPPPFSGAPPALACAPHLSSSIHWCSRFHCRCENTRPSLCTQHADAR